MLNQNEKSVCVVEQEGKCHAYFYTFVICEPSLYTAAVLKLALFSLYISLSKKKGLTWVTIDHVGDVYRLFLLFS